MKDELGTFGLKEVANTNHSLLSWTLPWFKVTDNGYTMCFRIASLI